MSANRAASVHARLLDRAKGDGADFNLTLTRYALERFLYRLSLAPARERFLLKGALLFDLWFGVPHRPTRDADFLGLGESDAETVIADIRAVCAIEADDGMRFDPTTVAAEAIRRDANYPGLRVTLLGRLGKARCPVQLDVGFGDAVTPGPLEAEYPTLLDDLPAPLLRVYPRETAIAEKLETIVDLGMINSRMKDYFDLLVLLRAGGLDAATVGRAIAATCRRRGTSLPAGWPLGLSDDFAADASKRRQWQAFLGRNALEAPALDAVVAELRALLVAPLAMAREPAR